MPMISNSVVSALPPGIELSAGRLTNGELKGTSGVCHTVGATYSTVCTQGGIRNLIPTAQTLKVVSTSADDTNSNGGAARRVRIRGIDSTGTEAQEDVNMNGTTAVSTTTVWLAINDFRVQRTGTGGGVNAGTINLTLGDGTTVVYQIAQGENQQQSASWTLPSTKIGYLTSFMVSATGAAQVGIWVCPTPGTTPFVQKLTVIAGTVPAPYQLPNPFQVDKGGIIEFRARSLTGGTVSVGADFQIIQES